MDILTVLWGKLCVMITASCLAFPERGRREDSGKPPAPKPAAPQELAAAPGRPGTELRNEAALPGEEHGASRRGSEAGT